MRTEPETEQKPAVTGTPFELATTSGSVMLAGGAAFEHIQRVSKLFASSDLVPDAFKGKPANCTIALEMAHRMGANPMAVMQNLYIVHGRPGWSAQFIVACLNQSGKFSPLRFDMTGDGDSRACVAWAIEKATNERLEGPPVSIKMAKDEGWHGKAGSKWKTMPDLMLRYRAATFFGRLYAPDILMGMLTAEEIKDSDERDVTPKATPPVPDFGKKKAIKEPDVVILDDLDHVAALWNWAASHDLFEGDVCKWLEIADPSELTQDRARTVNRDELLADLAS